MADWSDEELRASVVAYRQMQALERAGERLVKKQVYRDLAAQFGRTDKAFEFRMQNISAVLAMLGCNWISGLKPAAHVGAKVAAKLEHLINEVDGVQSTPRVEFEVEVREKSKHGLRNRPEGQASPNKTIVAATAFARDPAVKAWVLARAKGHCESCGSPAPFVMQDDTPFLEVHHLRTLAEGGSDRVSNSVALCPNCHRQLHYGKQASDVRAAIFEKVGELRRE